MKPDQSIKGEVMKLFHSVNKKKSKGQFCLVDSFLHTNTKKMGNKFPIGHPTHIHRTAEVVLLCVMLQMRPLSSIVNISFTFACALEWSNDNENIKEIQTNLLLVTLYFGHVTG